MVGIANFIDHTINIRLNTPAVLKTLPHWVLWRYEQIKERQTKVLYNPNHISSRAKSNDPLTWGTFEQTLEILHQNYDRFHGVAFAFTANDPYAGIDMDDCIDPYTGEFTWGKELIDHLDSYTEISPSGCGVKIFLKGQKPSHARCKINDPGLCGSGAIEIYDQGRFFVVTGNHLPDTPKCIQERQAELTQLCEHYWPANSSNEKSEVPTAAEQTHNLTVRSDNRFNRCLVSMLTMDIQDRNDGSHRLIAAACRCIEHDLSDVEAIACLRAYEVQRPFPVAYRDGELVKRLRDAESMSQRGKALAEPAKPGTLVQALLDSPTDEFTPRFKNVQQMIEDYPQLRPPVVHGLLRQGETMNVIAAPKTGKSWLVIDMAMAIATGRKWLGCYQTQKGNVLILDNELHGETSANRVPAVAQSRHIDLCEIAQSLYIENMRGRLIDTFQLENYFNYIQPRQFKLIIMDAFYRFMPSDTDENDNGRMAHIYNQIDRYASRLECAFVLIHHTSKGNQSGKSVTDVGAGAGAQSRAADSHLVLRQHQEDNVIVLDAAVRSWAPVAPQCLSWEFPVWNPAPSLNPADLAMPARRNKKSSKSDPDEAKPDWTPELFIKRFLTEEPKMKDQIVLEAREAGLSHAKSQKLLGAAEGMNLVCRWKFGANQKVLFSTIPQPAKEDNPDNVQGN